MAYGFIERLGVFAGNTGFVLLLFAALIGPGRLMVRLLRLEFDSAARKNLHALAFGFGLVSLVLYGLGVAGFFSATAIAGVLAAGALAAAAEARALVREAAAGLRGWASAWRSSQTDNRQPATDNQFGRFEKWLAAGLAGYLLVLFLYCFLPIVHSDLLGYQLAVPQQWLLEGRVQYLPGNIVSDLPAGAWMLYAAVIGLRGDAAAGATACSLVEFGFFLAGLAALYLAVARLASARAALWAVALYATTTAVAYWSALPYTAASSTFFLILGLDWLSRWVARPADGYRPVVLAAVMGGLAALCKVHGALFAGAAGVLVVDGALRAPDGRVRRGLAAGALYAGIVAALAAPWLARSWLETGNPLFPVANRVFPSPYMEAGRDPFLPDSEEAEPLWMAAGFLWRYADNNSDPQKIIGPAWLAAVALALVQWRRLSGPARYALGLGLVYGLIFCVLRGNLRYANVLMAVLALPAGEGITAVVGCRLPVVGCDERRRVAVGNLVKGSLAALLLAAAFLVFRVHDFKSLAAQTRMVSGCWCRPAALGDYAALLGPEATNTVKVPGLAALLAARGIVPPGDRVLLAGIGKGYPLGRRYFNDNEWVIGGRWGSGVQAAAVSARLAELGVKWVIWPEPGAAASVSRRKAELFERYWTEPACVEFAESHTEVVARTPEATLRRLKTVGGRR